MFAKDRREAWKNSHPSIKDWLEGLKPKSQYQYLFYSYKYFMWIEKEAPEPYRGKTPEQLLDMQDVSGKKSVRETFEQVKLLKTWLNSVKAAYKTIMLMKSSIYSFYAHNYVPLPKDLNFNVNPDRPSVNGHLTIDELRKIILSCNELYQSVYTIMFQSAMGQDEFLYFNTHCWNQVKEQLAKGKQRIRVDLVGRKHRNLRPSGNYFTFFGRDGVTYLKKYLKHRQTLITHSEKAPSLNEAIFINEKLRQLTTQDISTYFKRHAMRLGIIKKVHGDERTRYRVHAHEMRDTFRTEWNLTEAKPFMAEFFMGHSIDSNNYNKIMQRPEWAEQQYALAEPYLNILSEDPRTIKTQDINKIIEERVKKRLAENEQKQAQENKTLKEGIAKMQEQINQIYKFWDIETGHKDAEIRKRDDRIEQILEEEEHRQIEKEEKESLTSEESRKQQDHIREIYEKLKKLEEEGII